jgi:peroxisomal membrane protein 4
LLIQRKVNGGKQKESDPFFAGLLGGYIVFGERTAINEQVHTTGSLYSIRELIIMKLDRALCRVAGGGIIHSTG